MNRNTRAFKVSAKICDNLRDKPRKISHGWLSKRRFTQREVARDNHGTLRSVHTALLEELLHEFITYTPHFTTTLHACFTSTVHLKTLFGHSLTGGFERVGGRFPCRESVTQM
eukprot:3793111-Amphidinium_carterae.1